MHPLKRLATSSLVVSLLTVVACGDGGDGSEASGDGGARGGSENGGGGGATSGSAATDASPGPCTGISGGRVVSSLTAAEREAACQGFNRCAVAPYRTDPAEAYCRSAGNLAVRLASPPPSTDEEAAALCSEAHDECVAKPQALANANAVVTKGLARTCEGTEACPSTVAEIERCYEDVAASSSWVLQACVDATTSVPPSKSFLDLPSCKALPLSCVLLFAEKK